MSKPILIANWKNHPGSPEAATDLLGGLARQSALYRKLALYIAPPFTYFESVSKRVKSYATLVAQDIYPQQVETLTGAVTADILAGFGVKAVIVGHSERRARGETDELVAAKVRLALRSGMSPIVCVGEQARDDDGRHLEFVRDELKASLAGVRRADAGKLVVAYEPVWAVGAKAKGAMSPADLTEMVIFIRKHLADLFGREVGSKVPILYGGSVDANNAREMVATGVRGLLVGRASLDPKAFAAIASALITRGK